MNTPANPATLLVHDGELTDVHELLGELCPEFVERRGELQAEDHQTPWHLVIATPRWMLKMPAQPGKTSTKQIAICDQDSRTLRNSLRRAGINMMVRRPVHPAALRALLLHALYSGPEKRRVARVSIGAPVRFRKGWRQHPAILADLSLGGCRLLTDRPVDRGKIITLSIPPEVTGRKALTLKAYALCCGPAEGEPNGTLAITTRFVSPSRKTLEAVKSIVQSHAAGPAQFETQTREKPANGAPEPAAAHAAPEPAAAHGAPEPAAAHAAPEQPAPAQAVTPSAPQPPKEEKERRVNDHHAMDRHLIALGDEASRVLMGRDISVRGMRVDANPLLVVGEQLTLAIHVNGRKAPMVLRALALRDDGEHGMALRFLDIKGETRRTLSEAIKDLPVLEPDESENEQGYIMSEILSDANELPN